MYTSIFVVLLNLSVTCTASEAYTASYHALPGELTEVVFYYPNGTVLQRGYMIDDIKTGEWITYALSGEITARAYYAEGEKTGTWKVYDQEGNVTYKIRYRDDRKVWARQFDAEGNQTAYSIK